MNSSFSLQTRLLLRTMCFVLLVWGVTAVMVWAQAGHEIDELLDAHLAQVAALLAVQQVALADVEEVYVAPTLHKYAHRVAYQVFDGDDLVLHSPNVTRTPMASHTKGFDTLTFADGKAWRVFVAPSHNAKVRVYVAERVDSRDDIMAAVLSGYLLPLTVALPLLLLGLWWNVRIGLKPLERLRQVLLQRETHALDQVSLPDSPQEVQPLIDSLNDLLQRLAKRMNTERRFTADAAHELRTPIAAIRVQAQVALGAGGDNKARQQALQDTLKGCDRATRVVEQLLILARVEGAAGLDCEPFRLDQLTQQIASELAPEALRREQSLVLSAPQALSLHGPSTLWQILLRNLVDNALRYSPPGASIHIDAHALEDGTVVWSVQDSGPGLPAADIARLGERFFRGSSALATGSGLGWSIVHHIAALIKMDVEVFSSKQWGGLAVVLRYRESTVLPARNSGD